MRNILLLIIALLSAPWALQAQRNCAATEILEQQIQEDPTRLERMEAIEAHTREFTLNPASGRNVITIPVVVNVLYNNNAENVSDAQIQSQIDVLNEDFRRTNSDADGTWSQATDTEIEFCLATVDPSGNPTDGIRRKSTTKRDWRTNDDMKRANKGGLNPWDASQYMNIWVCDIKGGILGYAQFPGGPAATDGIVIDYAYFGRGGSAQAPFDLGRTGTHEVGHYLNLRHIWGDGPCGADDFVGDTPTSDGPNYGCAVGTVSCSSVDMVQNYMDYSDDFCMNLFTNGQSDRMQALFAAGGVREALSNSSACGGGNPPPPPPTPTCTDGVQNGQETGVDCGGPDCSPCAPVACTAPTGLGTNSVQGGKKADLFWNAAAGANSYFVEHRAQGAGSWNSETTTNTTIRITGLTKNNGYEFRVTSNCDNGTETSEIHQFTAGSSSRLGQQIPELMVFPNPARDVLNVDLSQLGTQDFQTGTAGVLDLSIFSSNGSVVLSRNFSGNEELVQLQTTDLHAGVFTLIIRTDNGNIIGSRRFIIQR